LHIEPELSVTHPWLKVNLIMWSDYVSLTSVNGLFGTIDYLVDNSLSITQQLIALYLLVATVAHDVDWRKLVFFPAIAGSIYRINTKKLLALNFAV